MTVMPNIVNVYLITGKVFVGVDVTDNDEGDLGFKVGKTFVLVPKTSVLYIEGSDDA